MKKIIFLRYNPALTGWWSKSKWAGSITHRVNRYNPALTGWWSKSVRGIR